MRKCLVLLVVAVSACGSDNDQGATVDTTASGQDSSAATEVEGDTSAATDIAIADSADDTDTADATTSADTGEDSATTATTTTIDEDVLVAVDVDEDTTTAACLVDNDCVPQGIVPPPVNECLVPRCIDGACVQAAPDCDDGDPCTIDGCDPHTGCAHGTLSVDVDATRVFLCPDALSEADARAACGARGEELLLVDTLGKAEQLAALLGDLGAGAAWIDMLSGDFCIEPKRIVQPQCDTLDASGCTVTTACSDVQPFACQIACNDGDPCTTDLVGADGLCTTVPVVCADDGDPCTTETCDPRDGTCTHHQDRSAWDATHELVACPGPLTWDEASAKCAGGTFALPTTPAQADALAAIAASSGASPALWAPLRQVDGGDPWLWVAGGGSGEPAWCSGSPSNTNEAGYCADRSTVDACLRDGPCDALHSFGCVFDTTIP